MRKRVTGLTDGGRVRAESASRTRKGTRAVSTGRARRPRSSTRKPLSRRLIVKEALELVDRHGLEALSMRHLAKRLHVEAMSLYGYFPSKQALLDGVLELVLAEVEFSIGESRDPATQAVEMAHQFRNALKRHWNVVPLFSRGGTSGTRAQHLRPVEAALELAARFDLGPREALQAYSMLLTYVIGFVLAEASGRFITAEGTSSFGSADVDKTLKDAAPTDFPRLREASRFITEIDADEQFGFGLDVILAGLVSKFSSG